MRFIPAFAGNAAPCRRTRHTTSVHPRVCGVRRSRRLKIASMSGSSPRLRGTHLLDFIHTHLVRFIPAFAGNAWSRPERLSTGSVHPRVCGERPTPIAENKYGNGSSPRLRGTHGELLEYAEAVRFIPAFAGNARRHLHQPGISPVHPRVCGERVRKGEKGCPVIGSSPRLR